MNTINAAVIAMPGNDPLPRCMPGGDMAHDRVVAVTDSADFARRLQADRSISFSTAHLQTSPFDAQTIAQALRTAVAGAGAKALLAVDMRWGIETAAASANFEIWGALCADLAATELRIVSVYDWQMLTGDQLLAALRGHQQFLAPDGLHDNPFWLPNAYLATASLREQVSFLLGRVVPSWQPMVLDPGADGQAAMGADPGWLPVAELRPMRGLGQRWKIRCFGRLRVYTSDSQQIDWQISGGAPRKIKALFAYLLTRGEAGAAADRLAEFLWPDGSDEDAKRARLHHTVAMLRKVLGHKDFIERRGDWYHLRPPPGSWIDIHTFEQFCRRAKALERESQFDQAYAMLQAAERLYTGDLFEDLSQEYVESEVEDWCLPQRAWLRDMALKVHRDMAMLLRRRGKLRDAIKHCQRALDIDPTCEIAHEEAMRIFHAQGRQDAMARQYRQYVDALADIGGDTTYPPLQSIFQGLISGH
ncbi:BTAD domain-containing putative transcriptional regulator [Yoonia sp.]|uniref:AfsR/SARP family transcriptional regulator n=1 Tax=Yoonia sp. TaxID=2212373 RepID=UPI001A00F19B|nr:BTAD domain-containing putative transcriptional regulator [Yoonia sp.]MBE0413709.1 tetratricopeptide repeat protein [Yoonia sp.]